MSTETIEARVDGEALLAALVLDPSTFSRNRYFTLYKDPEVRRLRRRATMVRSVVGQLGSGEADVKMTPRANGGAELTYVVASLGLRRTVRLEEIEVALLRFVLARVGGPAATRLPPDDGARARIESALARLAPKNLASSAGSS